MLIDSGLIGLGGVPREQRMLKGHLPRFIYHRVYLYTKMFFQEGNTEKERSPEVAGFIPALSTLGMGRAALRNQLNLVHSSRHPFRLICFAKLGHLIVF